MSIFNTAAVAYCVVCVYYADYVCIGASVRVFVHWPPWMCAYACRLSVRVMRSTYIQK